jgi:Helix-turn-helix domain
MNAALLILDNATRVHLSAALRQYRERRDRSREDVPDGLLEVEEALRAVAWDGQEWSGADNAPAPPMMDDVNTLGLRIPEAARALRVSEKTLRREIERGALHPKHIRGRPVLPVDDLRAYLNATDATRRRTHERD